MRDKKKQPLRLEGTSVILEEISPKFFANVIQWRNNPELNRYLNQPFVLTMELEHEWYEKHYVTDDTQGFMVMVDKKMLIPFGTVGWAHMDMEARRCTGERLIVGDKRFQVSAAFFESFFLVSDYLYQYVDVMYGHVAIDNQKAVNLNYSMGFRANEGEIQYPENLLVNGLKQREIYRTKEMYRATKDAFWEKLKRMFRELRDKQSEVQGIWKANMP